jgi:hypothetical protein
MLPFYRMSLTPVKSDGLLDNLTPSDVYFGRSKTILIERERIKRQTIPHRCLQHRARAVYDLT